MVYFLILVLLITVSLLASLTASLKKSYRDKENDMLVNQAKQAVMNIENRISYYQSFLELFMNDREFIRILENEGMPEIDQYMTDKTSDFLQMNVGGIRGIRIHKVGFYNVEYEQRGLSDIYTSLKLNSVTRPDNEYWTGTYLNNSNEKVFSVFKRIYQTNPDRSYYAELCLYETELYGFFNEDKSGNRIYIEKNGHLMSMSDRDSFNNLLYEAGHQDIANDIVGNSPEQIYIHAPGNNGWEAVISTDAGYLDRGFYKALSDIVPIISGVLILALILILSISRNLNRRMEIVRLSLCRFPAYALPTRPWADGGPGAWKAARAEALSCSGWPQYVHGLSAQAKCLAKYG